MVSENLINRIIGTWFSNNKDTEVKFIVISSNGITIDQKRYSYVTWTQTILKSNILELGINGGIYSIGYVNENEIELIIRKSTIINSNNHVVIPMRRMITSYAKF